jgi:hypothetical protein
MNKLIMEVHMSSHRSLSQHLANNQSSLLLTLIMAFFVPDMIAQPTEHRTGMSYYAMIQSTTFSGSAFPQLYDAYLSTGFPSTNYNSFYPMNFQSPKFKLGYGGGIGWHVHEAWFMGSIEIAYSWISHPNGTEVLQAQKVTPDSVHLLAREYSNISFPQTARKNSAIDIGMRLGFFPSGKFNLCFYVSFGFGYGWQSFNSSAVSYAEKQGYNINTAGKSVQYDIGDYKGNGGWSRSSSVHFFGLGSEMFLKKNISLRLDYKALRSSYTRHHVLIAGGSGFVNVYQEEKDYSYSFANLFSLGILYFWEL